jgi:hypothetical protein
MWQGLHRELRLNRVVCALVLLASGWLPDAEAEPDPALRLSLPTLPKPGLTLHVAPGGADTNAGTARKPFASLERAREEIRTVRARKGLPAGGVEVLIHGGRYAVRAGFTLGEADSGTETAPIIYRAAKGEEPVFSGSVVLRQCGPVTDPGARKLLRPGVLDQVQEADLAANGVTPWPLVLGGFASGRGFKSHPVPQLFWQGEPLRLARGPNSGWVRIESLLEPQTNFPAWAPQGSKVGKFVYDGDRPARWAAEPDLLLYGYWYWGWADSYERVDKIDPVTRQITLKPPYSTYGYGKGQLFCAINALSELDEPGEYCVDSRQGKIYFLPPAGSAKGPGVVELAVAQSWFVDCNQLSHVRFEGITWEHGCADALRVREGKGVLVAGCTVRGFGGNAVQVAGGSGHGLLSCDIYSLGRGGVEISGGDRRTLVPANHFVENCHIYDLSRIDHTYTPGVLCSGVGSRIRHNWLHDIASSAVRVGGNNHLIEFNEMNRVVAESDDQGGVDMWGNPTFLGNVYQYNYFHHIGGGTRAAEKPVIGKAGIRLDDAITGTQVRGNVFYLCGAGKGWCGAVQIHGGKDNVLENNVFASCAAAVSFTPWNSNHWASFTAGPRSNRDFDPGLYASRYREFERLDQELNVNWIRSNIVLNCAEFLHRESPATRHAGNLVTTNNPGFSDPARGEFGITPGKAAAAVPGFRPIPFEQIGLYRDGWRRSLPEPLNRRLRAE